MAAFDNVSKIAIKVINRDSVLDLREATLPTQREETDFDPRQHRNPANPIKLWMAYLNLIRIGFGAGVLGVPLAISQAGLILGSVMSICTGMMLVHTHLLLVNCLNDVCKQFQIPHISYRWAFRIALLHGPPICQSVGKYGTIIIAIFMLLSQVGICTVFVTFTSDSLRDMMDWESSRPALLTLLGPYLLFLFFMRKLTIITYVNMCGNIFNIIGLSMVVYHIFDEPRKNYKLYDLDPMSLIFAFGSFLFNYSAIGVVLSMDRALEKPEYLTKPSGILIVGLSTSIIFATIFGALGYWSFGIMEENILRSLPFDTYTTMAAIGLYLISIGLTYPLQCYPAIALIVDFVKYHDSRFEPSDQALKVVEIVSRPVFVLTTFLIAYLVPFQGPIVAFVGCLCTSLMAVVFPAMMDICLMYPGPYGKFHCYLIKDLLLIVVGIGALAFGVALNSELISIRILVSKSPNHADFF